MLAVIKGKNKSISSQFPQHEVTYSITTHPLDRMLFHSKVPPPPAFHQASLTIHQYPFVLLGGELGTERVKGFAQGHKKTDPARS